MVIIGAGTVNDSMQTSHLKAEQIFHWEILLERRGLLQFLAS